MCKRVNTTRGEVSEDWQAPWEGVCGSMTFGRELFVSHDCESHREMTSEASGEGLGPYLLIGHPIPYAHHLTGHEEAYHASCYLILPHG